MNWGFLSEFWDAISEKTIEAWHFTADWFQQIGLAVAGAIGNFFDYLIHSTSDFFVFISWIFTSIKELISAVLLPISYIVNFLSGFISSATKEPVSPEASYTFSTSTMSIFQSIPYWDTLSYIIGVSILIIGAGAIIYLILRI